MPCVVGCWGYYLLTMGVEKLKKHWRYLVARWGAHPAVWVLAGEGSMPYYLSKTKDEDKKLQMNGWSEIGRYLQEIDPYDHPITIHPPEVPAPRWTTRASSTSTCFRPATRTDP